VNKDLS